MPSLLNAVKKGLLTETEIDRSVKRLIMARMKLGEFDPENEVPFSNIPLSVVDGKEHQAIALDAARKSMVLLKNENNTLPFSKKNKECGCYRTECQQSRNTAGELQRLFDAPGDATCRN